MRKADMSMEEQRLLKQIESEHEIFHYKMLSKQSAEIYQACNEIQFKECCYEYLLYKEDIDPKYITVCLKVDNVLDALFALYLKYENLKCSTWQDIEEILELLVKKCS